MPYRGFSNVSLFLLNKGAQAPAGHGFRLAPAWRTPVDQASASKLV